MTHQIDLKESGRRKPRYQLALKAEVWVRGLEHYIVEKTANISQSGLFLCTEVDLPVNDRLHIRIIFKDLDAYFDVKARVVWRCDGLGSHPQGLGLEYTELTEFQSEVIKRYLTDYINVRDS